MKDFDFRSPKNIFYLSVIGISVIAMIVLFTGFLKDKSGSDTDSATAHATLAPKKEKVLVTTSTETIEDGLRDMGVLITQEYYFTQVEKYTKEKKILNMINSSSEFIYSYDGSVSAGIDFGGITLTKDDENKTITVDIPESEIQTVNIDTNTFQVYSEKDSIWNPMKLEDFNASLTDFEEAAKQKALDNGILKKSDDHARVLITNFIKNFASVSDYQVDFRTKE
ncbi:DUF4230 domain-containing protein [Butyrivibrio sp. CB08]|uniref:DUF4230 domain-containing protein n=1 Tax=Butyrivibrio sp. CB08 TaxID=2364879 RepID=UPI000EA97D2A|nr:DUF4230 domain-containing protein [Butyrivibrio sp. CB08]RKM59269.1 DUF4230 domain-containing protein [Butyrivibrio sp. CB08]